MCKKLIFVLAMVAMVSPAMAIIRGHYISPDDFPDGHPGDNILLKCDIEAGSDPNNTQAGWVGWEVGAGGPYYKDFGYGSGLPYVQLDGIDFGTGGGLGGVRQRVTFADDGTEADMQKVLGDIVFNQTGGGGALGQETIKLDFLFGSDYAGMVLQITPICWAPAIAGSGLASYGGAGEPPDSKFAAWSTTDPDAWLAANGFPDGYGYTPDGNMPQGLQDLVCGYAVEHGTAPWLSPYDDAYGMLYSSTCEVVLDETGKVTLYGWVDLTSEAGSRHLALNGFILSLPEPATIALLGLGGLALIRRKR